MDKEVVAIDGKTLRRSHDKNDSKAAIYMVSAWSTDRNLVWGQLKTAEKSNEIIAIPELIESLITENGLTTIAKIESECLNRAKFSAPFPFRTRHSSSLKPTYVSHIGHNFSFVSHNNRLIKPGVLSSNSAWIADFN